MSYATFSKSELWICFEGQKFACTAVYSTDELDPTGGDLWGLTLFCTADGFGVVLRSPAGESKLQFAVTSKEAVRAACEDWPKLTDWLTDRYCDGKDSLRRLIEGVAYSQRQQGLPWK